MSRGIKCRDGNLPPVATTSCPLLTNLEQIQTTKLGAERIKRNLDLTGTDDVVAWCKNKINSANNIVKRGKNWYVYTENAIITVNASSFTIITAHKNKKG